jgi:hypothetical protein
VFEIMLVERWPESVVHIDCHEDNCQIVFSDRRGKQVEVALSFEGRGI